MAVQDTKAKALDAEAMAGISDNVVVKVSRCFQAVREGDVFLERSPVPLWIIVGSPHGIQRFNAHLIARTSQDCGSSTA
jgi:hypothetical protein